MNWWLLLPIWLLVNALFVVLRTPVRRAKDPNVSHREISP